MVNKDFLRDVLAGKKDLMPLDQVKLCTVPSYDELSVKNMWPQMTNDPEFMKYFPSKLPKGRLPEREYFFNIMNSVRGEYTQRLIKHANEQRMTAKHEDMNMESILLTDRMWDQLNEFPHISSKFHQF